MDRIRRKLQDMKASIKSSRGKSSQKAFIEELFNDYYLHRRQVYKMNFFRGIFFGLGSVLGGTIVVALVVWILSLFVGTPLVGEYLEGIQRSIDDTGENR